MWNLCLLILLVSLLLLSSCYCGSVFHLLDKIILTKLKFTSLKRKNRFIKNSITDLYDEHGLKGKQREQDSASVQSTSNIQLPQMAPNMPSYQFPRQLF